MTESEVEAACAGLWHTVDGSIERVDDEHFTGVVCRLSVQTTNGEIVWGAYRVDEWHLARARVDIVRLTFDRLVRQIEARAAALGEVLR